MFSGVRDAIIQDGSVCRSAIRIPSRLYNQLQLPEFPGARDIIARNLRVSGTMAAAFRQYPVIPQTSSIAATGGQLE